MSAPFLDLFCRHEAWDVRTVNRVVSIRRERRKRAGLEGSSAGEEVLRGRLSSIRMAGCVALVFCIMPLALSSCSMQKSKVDSARTENDSLKAADGSTGRDAAQEKRALKVDYLTPVAAIKDPEIFVYKDKRRLYIVQSNVLVRDYPIGLGLHPKGDKEQDGDGRTPEGEFTICVKNAGSRESLGLTYPDKKHAERAFFAGMLTPVEFREILVSYENRITPPWSTRLGGKIFIHAGGAHRDWTDGCVALYDSDMAELFRIASVGTAVTIRP